MQITGSQAIVKSLIHEGVDLIFGYPGGAIMPTYDALYDSRDVLHHVLVRHEQGATHAAVGYARATGNVGVCIATSGPGATNLITGMADALIDCVPMVCITGQVFSPLLGTDAFQEADIIGMSVPATKWNYQITDPKEVPYIIAKAFEIAKSGRPGPVLVDVTKDAQVGLLEYAIPEMNPNARWLQKNYSSDESIVKAAKLLNHAKRPLMLIGHGVMISGAEQEVLTLAEKTNMPVASTLLGLSSFPGDHPLYKGMLGMHGNYAANILSNQADVVLAVGMRFDDRVTGDLSDYLNDAKVIHVEIDQAELNKNVKADVAIQADAKEALTKLIQQVQSNQHPIWNHTFNECHQQEIDQVIAHESHPKAGEIKMAEVVAMLSEKTEGQAIIVTDVGQHQMISARYYEFKGTNAHITSGGLGTMGFALPAAIGAKMGQPEKQVVAIAGDGGFQMNIQELAVLKQENIPVKILILNNGYLGMVRQWQELFFEKRYSFTEMLSPDFVAVAGGYGIKGKCIAERGGLSDALDVMLSAQEPYLLEIKVEQQENVFPMVPAGCSISETKLSAKEA